METTGPICSRRRAVEDIGGLIDGFIPKLVRGGGYLSEGIAEKDRCFGALGFLDYRDKSQHPVFYFADLRTVGWANFMSTPIAVTNLAGQP